MLPESLNDPVFGLLRYDAENLEYVGTTVVEGANCLIVISLDDTIPDDGGLPEIQERAHEAAPHLGLLSQQARRVIEMDHGQMICQEHDVTLEAFSQELTLCSIAVGDDWIGFEFESNRYFDGQSIHVPLYDDGEFGECEFVPRLLVDDSGTAGEE